MPHRTVRIAVVVVLWWLAAASLTMAGAAGPGAASGPSAVGLSMPPPRLVVVISIDQFRADYLTRFADLWLPAMSVTGAPGLEVPGKVGGFRYLMERGAYFTDARHDHYPLFTGPGHAVLLTGAPPYKSGIIGNSWFDRELGRRRYCVGDDDSPLVGTARASRASSRPGVSPATLRVSTVGDELKMATGGRARVWGLALKDRAAVLMAGRLADGALWFDEESGAWISSRFYRPDGTLPPWVAAWNAERHADAWLGKEWTLSVPAAALARVWAPGSRWVAAPAPLGAGFPHRVGGGGARPGKDFYNAFVTTPFGNDFTLEMARELIRREKLGQGEVPDLLAINLSSNDYVGHAYGPDSPEVLDTAVRTDRQLADFFAFLAQAVPGGLGGLLVVVTADHGVAPVPGAAREAKLPAGAYDEEAVAAAAEHALQAAYGPGKWVTALVEANLYLDLAALDAHQVQHAAAEDVAAAAVARLPGIYAAYGRTRILEGRLPRTDVGDRIERSFHPRLSGDLVLVSDPYWVPGKLSGTTHGTPYAYDTHVPLLLAGPGIRPGRYPARISTQDLAPTLADLLGLLPPAGSEGRILAEAER
jgi:predicted AlkP superfamily pyrophosphatase or phosphodiesterase